MAEEKRKHPRFTVSQFISISFDRENFVQVTAEDISQGGMRCRTTEPVDPLTRVFLMVTFPTGSGDHVLRTEGMVVHAQKEGDDYRLGVQFMDLAEDDRRALANYLSLLPET